MSDILDEFKQRIREGIHQSPNEQPQGSMTPPRSVVSVMWRPNNYRRGIGIKRVGGSTIAKIRSALYKQGLKVNYNPQNRMVSVHGFHGITVQVGRDKLMGIWSQSVIAGHKETFWVQANSAEDLEERLLERRKLIQDRIDNGMRMFAKQFGIALPYSKAGWLRHEDWIKGEAYIDSLPAECIIHDTYFKKVYGTGVEFVGGKGVVPAVRAKQYLKNRVVEDFAPEVARAIRQVNPLRELMRCRSISEVLQKKDEMEALLPVERVELEQWVFDQWAVKDGKRQG